MTQTNLDNTRCARCGQIRETHSVLTSFRLTRSKRLCAQCIAREQNLLGIIQYAILAVGGLVFLILKWKNIPLPEDLRPLWSVLGIVYEWVAIGWVMVWIHECAHALAAHLTGMRVLGMSLGRGPRVWQWKFGDFTLDWHLIPNMGLCRTQLRTNDGWRWRMAIMVAAGPAVHAIAVIAVLASNAHGGWMASHDTGTWEGFWFAVLLVNGLMLVSNLYPKSHAWNGQMFASDGARLLQLLRKNVQMKNGQILAEALRILNGMADQGRWPEVQQFARNYWQKWSTLPGAASSIGAWLAVADVWSGEESDLAEAAELSLRAMKETNWEVEGRTRVGAAIKAVRACVLLAMARDQEAEELLTEAWAGEMVHPARPAAARLWVELYRRRGQTDKQREFAELAATLDPNGAYDMKWLRKPIVSMTSVNR